MREDQEHGESRRQSEAASAGTAGGQPLPEAGEGAAAPEEAAVSQLGEKAPNQPPAAVEANIEEPPVAASVAIRKKHPLAIRWMHWINFPVLAVMIWSGLLIYWADSDHAVEHPHEVYRIGLGSFTLVRLFPPWFYERLHLTFQLAKGMGYHFFFMWLFAINGAAYVAYTALSGEWRALAPDRRSFGEAFQVLLHDLHLSKKPPPRRKYNGAQQIAYSLVILMGFGSLATGLAIYKPTQLGWLTALMGGYEMARWFHFWLTMGYCIFFLVHVAQVARAGWNNFRGMIAGYEIVPAVTQDEPHAKGHGA